MKAVPEMNFYAHTAEDKNGRPLPESSGTWQPLAAHLRKVADEAKKFAAPLGLTAAANCRPARERGARIETIETSPST